MPANQRIEVHWVEMRRGISFERMARYRTERQGKRRARDLRRRGMPAVVFVSQRMWHGGVETFYA